jgi:hypothetical protein
MRIRTLALLAALFAPTILLADSYTYTYTGQSFTAYYAYSGPVLFNSLDSVSGEFTLSAPLSDNLSSLTTINPASFSFTDDVNTITNLTANYSSFQVETNGHGDITEWTIFIQMPDPSGPGEDLIQTSSAPGSAYDQGNSDYYTSRFSCSFNCYYTDFYGSVGSNQSSDGSSAGAWAETNSSASGTPEPPSLMLLATGLFGAAALLRRRHQPPIPSLTAPTPAPTAAQSQPQLQAQLSAPSLA